MFDLIWMSNFLLPLSLICSQHYQYFLGTVTQTDSEVSLSTQILFLILSRTPALEKHNLSMLFQPLFYISHFFPVPFPLPISSLLPPFLPFLGQGLMFQGWSWTHFIVASDLNFWSSGHYLTDARMTGLYDMVLGVEPKVSCRLSKPDWDSSLLVLILSFIWFRTHSQLCEILSTPNDSSVCLLEAHRRSSLEQPQMPLLGADRCQCTHPMKPVVVQVPGKSLRLRDSCFVQILHSIQASYFLSSPFETDEFFLPLPAQRRRHQMGTPSASCCRSHIVPPGPTFSSSSIFVFGYQLISPCVCNPIPLSWDAHSVPPFQWSSALLFTEHLRLFAVM